MRENMAVSTPILDTISTHNDLVGLSEEQVLSLADEIRAFLIDNVTKTGGHLASNLGVVELTIAMHRVFETPTDHFIFDVGHQSYVHKILTGRKDAFPTLRQPGGLSGFTKRSESEHDCFGAGHSSTSISAALGFAVSDYLNGRNAYTVAVVGDGAFTGGMIHEALNNCKQQLPLIIILNENEMSISKNIGRFAKHLTKLRSQPNYLRTKARTGKFIKRIPLIGNALFRFVRDVKKALKNLLYGSNYFEDLGLQYLGPVDGGDEKAIETLLQEAKKLGQSCVVHVKTQKGKGYAPAEELPNIYHSLAPAQKQASEKKTFSLIMGDELCRLAEKDDRICAITAAMGEATGLEPFRQKFPDRFFDVGIAEEHAVTFAAGLAANGMKPVVAIYSTFLQRSYDNILHDVALQKLPVVFCIDRAGLNAADGATHHGIFDVAYMSEVPGMVIDTPITENGLRASLQQALLRTDGPVAIRYPNGVEDEEIYAHFYGDSSCGKEVVLCADYSVDEKGQLDAVLITDGRIVTQAMQAQRLFYEHCGKRVGILLLERIKPYTVCAREVALYLPLGSCKIVFLEEEIKAGGMGMLLMQALNEYDRPLMSNKQCVLLATDDSFAISEKNESIYQTAGVSAQDILDALQ